MFGCFIGATQVIEPQQAAQPGLKSPVHPELLLRQAVKIALDRAPVVVAL